MNYLNIYGDSFPIDKMEYWAIVGPKSNLVGGCMNRTILTFARNSKLSKAGAILPI